MRMMYSGNLHVLSVEIICANLSVEFFFKVSNSWNINAYLMQYKGNFNNHFGYTDFFFQWPSRMADKFPYFQVHNLIGIL